MISSFKRNNTLFPHFLYHILYYSSIVSIFLILIKPMSFHIVAERFKKTYKEYVAKQTNKKPNNIQYKDIKNRWEK